jgi:hypothetical protein
MAEQVRHIYEALCDQQGVPSAGRHRRHLLGRQLILADNFNLSHVGLDDCVWSLEAGVAETLMTRHQ